MKFNFRLQKLLGLREAVEKQQATIFGAAAETEAQQQLKSERSAEQLDQIQSQLSQPTTESIPAGLYHAYGLTVEAAAARAEQDQAGLKEAQAERAAEEARYHEARIARKVVERLKERKESEWQSEIQQAEQKELDEVARQRGQQNGDGR